MERYVKIDPPREPFRRVPDHVVSMVNFYPMEAFLRGVCEYTVFVSIKDL